MKREIEAIRLKTKMSEAFHATNVPYPKQREFAIAQLNALQENYKQLTGAYAPEFQLQEKLAQFAELELDELIDRLNKIKEKVGGTSKIQVQGTLMSKDDGNTIILSTEKQM
jgi:hypothetical protein